MKKQNFLQGALILVLASMIVKIFGAIFKIPLTNIIGVTSMAYFNTAYGFYVIFYMISTAGIPVALSKLISSAEARNNKKETAKIFKVAYILFFILGFVGSLLMLLFSKNYSRYVHLDGLHYSIISISITLFFMCITSAYRGYFQGLNNMTPTAISQIIGAVGKLFIGLIVAYFAVKANLPSYTVSALTLLGITTGSIGSTIFLYFYKKICDKKESYSISQLNTPTTPSSKLLKELVIIAIPITLSATILSLTNTIDTTLMVRRLVKSGIDTLQAQKIMGAYTSMSVPINNLAPNLIYPFAVSVLPTVTGMFVSNKSDEANKVISSILRIASMISIPCSIGLIAFSSPIVSLLYNSNEYVTVRGKDLLATDIAANMLSVLAISVFFVSMVSVSNALLQAYGQEKKTIISTTIGILLKVILNYVLIGNNKIALYGAPIATVVAYMIIMILNFYFLLRYTPCLPKIFTTVAKPLFSAIVSIGLCNITFNLLKSNYSEKLLVIVLILIAIILYFALLFVVKGVSKDDIRMLPKGKKIENLLVKVKIMK